MRLKIVAMLLPVMLAVACVDNSEEDRAVKTGPAANTANPAYVVFNYEISDRGAYDPYLMQVPETLEAFGAEVIVADFESEAIEGDAGGVTVVLKFDSEDAARNWYQSPQYQRIIELRTSNSSGLATLARTATD